MPLRRFKPNLRVSRERRLSGSNQQQQQSKPSSSATACSGADPAVLSPEEVNSSPLATEEPTQPTEQSPTNTATITSAINTEPSVATSSDSDRSEKILSAAPIRDSHVSQPLSMTSSESARGVKVQRVRRRIAPLVPSRTRVARRGERPVSNSCLSPLSSPNQPLDREGSLDTAEHSDRASSPFSPSQHPPRTTDCAESFGPPPPSSSSTELTAVDTCSAPVRGLTSPGIHSSDSTHDIQSSSTVGQCSSVPAQPVEDGEEDSLEPKTTHRGGRRGSRGRRRSSQSVSVGEGGGGEGGRGRGESSSRMGGTRQTTAAKV